MKKTAIENKIQQAKEGRNEQRNRIKKRKVGYFAASEVVEKGVSNMTLGDNHIVNSGKSTIHGDVEMGNNSI